MSRLAFVARFPGLIFALALLFSVSPVSAHIEENAKDAFLDV